MRKSRECLYNASVRTVLSGEEGVNRPTHRQKHPKNPPSIVEHQSLGKSSKKNLRQFAVGHLSMDDLRSAPVPLRSGCANPSQSAFKTLPHHTLNQASKNSAAPLLCVRYPSTQAPSEFKSHCSLLRVHLPLFKTISTATASRDLKHGVESGLLQKQGEKSQTAYEFQKS